ncbi:MAG: entericidin [Betaproteobacteria bacterium RBG_16_56_24]|nr:MAG: entericidin [Betaproteobacteria bacterium RBG_16_56_24]
MKVVVLLLVALALAGCNAMEGLNKDLKKGGEKIKRAVNS